MSCRTVQSFTFLSLGASLTATTALALPADVGRTADVFTNAIRFQEAAQVVVFTPKARPAELIVAASAEPATPTTPSRFDQIDEAFSVALEPVDLGPRWISAFTDDDLYAVSLVPDADALLNIPTHYQEDVAFGETLVAVDVAALDIPAGHLEDAAFGQGLEAIDVATLDIPARFQEDVAFAKPVERIALASAAIPLAPKEDEAFGVTVGRVDMVALNIPAAPQEDAIHDVSLAPVPVVALNIPTHFKEDELFKVALDPIDMRTLAVARATYDDAFEVPLQPISLASLDVPPALFEQAQDADKAEILQAAIDQSEEALAANSSSRSDSDIMSQMADSDDNLVMRDGGEDGVDTMMMSSDVLFSFGSATLADDAFATLASIGDMADDVPVIEVFGHTDAIGSETNNLRLGQERAEAVRAWLLENTAFTAEQIIATGIGEVDPVAPNLTANGDDNPDGRAQNRRVEFAFHEAGYVPE